MIRHASFLIVANVLRYVAQLFTLVLILHVSHAGQAGAYALAIAITGPIFILLSFGMRTLVLTLHAPIAVAQFSRFRTGTNAIAFFCSLAIGVVLGASMFELVLLVAVSKVIDAYMDLFSAYLQDTSRFMALLVLSALNFVFISLGVCVGAVLSSSASIIVLSSDIGATASVVVTGIVALRRSGGEYRRGSAGEAVLPGKTAFRVIAKSGLPVGIGNGLVILLTAVPQYFLAGNLGHAAVVNYVVCTYVLVAAEILLNGISQAWISRVRNAQGAGVLGVSSILRSVGGVTAIVTPVAWSGLAIAYFLFPPVFGPHYRLTAIECGVLAACLLVSPAVFIGATALSVKGIYTASTVNSGIALAVCIAASVVFVPAWGVDGALVVTLLCLSARAVSALVTVVVRGRGSANALDELHA